MAKGSGNTDERTFMLMSSGGNAINSYSDETEAVRDFRRIVLHEPEAEDEMMVIAFDADGMAVDTLDIPAFSGHDTPYYYSIEHDGMANQDGGSVDLVHRAAVVLDGLGGHRQSELATLCALEVAEGAYKNISGNSWAWTKEAFQQMRTSLLQLQTDEQIDGSCAIVLAHELHDKMTLCWAGDCRAWRRRADGWLERLTDDHDIVSNLVERGLADPVYAAGVRVVLDEVGSGSEAYQRGGSLAKKAWTKRNLMFADLARGECSFAAVDWAPDDTLILTTDGIHDNLTGTTIREIVKNTPPDEIAQTLVNAAKEFALTDQPRAHDDDITCVVLPPAIS